MLECLQVYLHIGSAFLKCYDYHVIELAQYHRDCTCKAIVFANELSFLEARIVVDHKLNLLLRPCGVNWFDVEIEMRV